MKRFVIFMTAFIIAMFFYEDVNAQDIKIGGYMQNWLTLDQGTPKIAGTETTSGFRIRRARLNFKSDINETFAINSWFEFAEASKNMLDFYLTAKVSPELMFTVGQFITPAQAYETARLSSSKIPFYELADISLNLSKNMGHDSYRDVGIMASGKIDFLEYSAYYGNGNGRFFYTSNNIINRKFGNGLIGLRLDAAPIKGLSIGAHYSSNIQDSNYVSDPITAAKSIRYRDRNSYSFNIVTDGLGLPELFSTIVFAAGKMKDANTDYDGITATLGYKITSAIHVIGRYDTYNEEKKNLPDFNTSSVVLGMSYLFLKENNEIAKIALNYQIRNEDQTALDNNTLLLWMQIKF